MKNKEKYAAELMEIAISGDTVAVFDGKPVSCGSKNNCGECICLNEYDCCDSEKVRVLAEAEYMDPPVD